MVWDVDNFWGIYFLYNAFFCDDNSLTRNSRLSQIQKISVSGTSLDGLFGIGDARVSGIITSIK